MTTTRQAIAWLATAALGATVVLPASAHHHHHPRGNVTPSPHARGIYAPPAHARLHGAPPMASHRHHHHHHHGSPPRVIVVPRHYYVAPPVVRYVSPPIVVAPAPVYAPPTAYVPPAPPVEPPSGWYEERGPFMALDGGSFIARGVTYVLAGLRSWDVTTPAGAAARERLQQLLQSGTVNVWRVADDSYGRAVARVVVNGVEIAELLRREGFAA